MKLSDIIKILVCGTVVVLIVALLNFLLGDMLIGESDEVLCPTHVIEQCVCDVSVDFRCPTETPTPTPSCATETVGVHSSPTETITPAHTSVFPSTTPTAKRPTSTREVPIPTPTVTHAPSTSTPIVPTPVTCNRGIGNRDEGCDPGNSSEQGQGGGRKAGEDRDEDVGP